MDLCPIYVRKAPRKQHLSRLWLDLRWHWEDLISDFLSLIWHSFYTCHVLGSVPWAGNDSVTCPQGASSWNVVHMNCKEVWKSVYLIQVLPFFLLNIHQRNDWQSRVNTEITARCPGLRHLPNTAALSPLEGVPINVESWCKYVYEKECIHEEDAIRE